MLLFDTWNNSTVYRLWLGKLWLNKQRNTLSILTGRRNAEPVYMYSGVSDHLATKQARQQRNRRQEIHILIYFNLLKRCKKAILKVASIHKK